MNRSLQMIQNITEKGWSAQGVPLAKKFRKYLLRKAGKIFLIAKKEFSRDFPDETPEDITRAIGVLRSNAALFPITKTQTFKINWKRLSSVRL